MTGYERIFLDTSPIIYFMEESDLYFEKMKSIFRVVIDDDIRLCTSTVTYEEYEVGPYRSGNLRLITKFEEFIRDMDIAVVDIDRSIAARAATLRGEYVGYKGMDALQLACAMTAGCDLFLTNDKQLRQTRQTRQIPVATVDELWNAMNES